ncbi:hypothetical protein NDU88_007542 [Pleurodeles waltl]|uniref:Uncharacterized protein n=1 Tax=Pleurodeles waltl TaxID=8319 RepID=A0AAV7QKY5_PLEWA|nr:hypothetical protein NDU88_007542 [Pleurodeles waltl]
MSEGAPWSAVVENGEQVRTAGLEAQGPRSPREAATDPPGNRRGPGTTKKCMEDGQKIRGPQDRRTAERGLPEKAAA